MKNTERVSVGKYTLTVLKPNSLANPATALAVTSSLLPLTLKRIYKIVYLSCYCLTGKNNLRHSVNIIHNKS